MKTKIKAIISAAIIGAMAIGGAASAATISSDNIDLSDEAAVSAAVTDKEIDDFNEKLLAGYKAADPFLLASHGKTTGALDGTDLSKKYSADETLAPKATIGLDLIHDHSEGYQLWSGRFVTDDVGIFAASFTEPDAFDLRIGNTSTITADSPYAYNFKEVTINYTYLKNGRRVTKSAHGEGNSSSVDAEMGDQSGNGELVEAAYYFYLHAGTGSTAALYEVAVVHVVDKDYANSQGYSALPYSRLIDSYTYLDAADVGMMPKTVTD